MGSLSPTSDLPAKDEVYLKIGKLEKKGQLIWSHRFVALSRSSLQYSHGAPVKAEASGDAEISEDPLAPSNGLAKVDLEMVNSCELSDSNTVLSIGCDPKDKDRPLKPCVWALFRADPRTAIEWRDAITTVSKLATLRHHKMSMEASLFELSARRITVHLDLPPRLGLSTFRARVCPALSALTARLTVSSNAGFRLAAPDDPESFDLPFLFNEFGCVCPKPLPQSLYVRLLFDSARMRPDQLNPINSSQLAQGSGLDMDEGFRIFDVVARFVPEERTIVLCLPCVNADLEISQLSLCIKILCQKFAAKRRDAALRILTFMRRFVLKGKHRRRSSTPVQIMPRFIGSDDASQDSSGDERMATSPRVSPFTVHRVVSPTPRLPNDEGSVSRAKSALLRFFKTALFRRRLELRRILLNKANECIRAWFSSLPKSIGLLFFTDSHTLTLDYSTLYHCLQTFVSRFFERSGGARSATSLTDLVFDNFRKFELFLETLVDKLSQDSALTFFVQHFRYYVFNDQASLVPSWRFDFAPVEKDCCRSEDSNSSFRCPNKIVWPRLPPPPSPKDSSNDLCTFFSASFEQTATAATEENFVLVAKNRADLPESFTFSFTIPVLLDRDQFFVLDEPTMSRSVRDFVLSARVIALEHHLQHIQQCWQGSLKERPIVRLSVDLEGCSESEPWIVDGHIRSFMRCITGAVREILDGSWCRDSMSDLKGLVPVFYDMLLSTSALDLRTSFFESCSAWEDSSVDVPSPVTVQTLQGPDGRDSYSLSLGFAKALGEEQTCEGDLRSSTPLSYVSTAFDLRMACEGTSRSLRLRQILYTLAASRLTSLLATNHLVNPSTSSQDENDGCQTCLMFQDSKRAVHIHGIPGEIIFRILCPSPSFTNHLLCFSSLAMDHYAFGDTYECLPRLAALAISSGLSSPTSSLLGDYPTPPRGSLASARGSPSSQPTIPRGSPNLTSSHAPSVMFPEQDTLRGMFHALSCLESRLPERIVGSIIDSVFTEERFLTQDIATPFPPISEIIFRHESFLKNADVCSMAYEPSCGRLTVVYRPDLPRLQELEDSTLKNKLTASLWLAFMNSGIEEKAWRARSFINTMYELRQSFTSEADPSFSIDMQCFFAPIAVPLLSSLLVDCEVQWWSDVLQCVIEKIVAQTKDKDCVVELVVDPASRGPLTIKPHSNPSTLCIQLSLFSLSSLLENWPTMDDSKLRTTIAKLVFNCLRATQESSS